jgi:hypothetical protein
MANSVYQGVHYVDTVGIISKVPLWIQAILYYPNAVSNALDLNFWDETTAALDSYMTATASSGTVTDADTGHNVLTSTACPDGSVVQVLSGDGDAGNKTYHLIGTAGNDDRIIITPTSTWADEAAKTYRFKVFPARAFFNCLQPTATNTHESKFQFFGGAYVPNLICEGITASSYAIIYTK